MPIFSGLQQRRHKAAPTSTVTKPPHVTVIQSAATLLATEKRQQYIKNIKSLLNLPPKLHQNLYQQVIEQFAEFVQSLPETVQGAFSTEYGFLDHGLERASRALTLCLAYFFPQEKTFQSASSLQALWVYAVFTAALLYDIGKLAVKYQIEICHKDGSSVRTWSPYTCSMVAQGKYYKYEFVKENRDNLRRLVTALLARQVLSEAEDTDGSDSGSIGGFNWIASNPDVLEAWLALLSGDMRSVSSFLTVIPLADIQTIDNHIRTNKTPGSLFDNPLGEEFFKWLQEAIANQKLSVNKTDSLVHLNTEGQVLIDPAIFAVFTHENPQHNTGSIEQQFREQLKVYQASIGDLVQQYRHVGSNLARDYFVVNNALLIFSIGGMPANYSDLSKVQTPSMQPVQPVILPKPISTPPAPK